ncbi:MAG: hypothetical protein IBX41_05630 [Methanophagales archaeon]|nr:hypothetical protein [Methanophagales archaeon]
MYVHEAGAWKALDTTGTHFSTFVLFAAPPVAPPPTPTPTPPPVVTPTPTPPVIVPPPVIPWALIIGIVIAMIIVGAAAYYIYTKKKT